MKINISYFENSLEINSDCINSIEIENKKIFYRLLCDLNDISNGIENENIKIFENNKKISIINKINIITDYVNFDFQKYTNSINKYIIENIKGLNDNSIVLLYKKLIQKYNILISNLDLPITISNENTIESLSKIMKVKVNLKNTILDNLFLIIDLEKILKLNKALFLVNLKQYLTINELEELYKYSIYNNVNIILIDSQSYGCTQNFENKLIVDDILVEFMIK